MVAAIEMVGPDRPRPRPAGGAGTSIHLGIVDDLELNAEVKGDLWYGDGTRLGLAAQMMRDGHVRQSVDARTSPLISALWDVEPASDDPLDMEAADFVRFSMLERLNWQGLIRLGTTGYTRDGFFAAEFTDDVQPVPQNRFPLHPQPYAALVYTGVHHRPAFSKRGWIQSASDPSKVDGMRQWIPGSDEEDAGEREIRLSKGALFFRLTYEQEGADFDGFAALRSAWGPFKEKRLIKIIKMIRHEREGAPIPELSEPASGEGAPADKSEAETAKEILRNLRSHEQSYLHLPPGWKFRWVPGGGQSTGLREDESGANFDIAYNMGVAWMLLGSNKEGSHALAATQQGHYIMSCEQQARFWEYALNVGQDGWSPVARCVRLNYGANVGMPRVLVRNMPLRDLTNQLTVIPQLIQTQALVMDEPARAHVRVSLGFPKADRKTATPLNAPAPGANE